MLQSYLLMYQHLGADENTDDYALEQHGLILMAGCIRNRKNWLSHATLAPCSTFALVRIGALCGTRWHMRASSVYLSCAQTTYLYRDAATACHSATQHGQPARCNVYRPDHNEQCII